MTYNYIKAAKGSLSIWWLSFPDYVPTKLTGSNLGLIRV